MDDTIVVGRPAVRKAEPVEDSSAPPSSSALPDASRAATGNINAQLSTPRAEDPRAVPLGVVPPTASADHLAHSAEDSNSGIVNGHAPAGRNSAEEHRMTDAATTPARFSIATVSSAINGQGRVAKRASFLSDGTSPGHDVIAIQTNNGTPRSSARGRPRGRPRGRGRGAGRAGKRKRDDDNDDEDHDGDSDSSDEVTPVATMTKSGRSVQKPTSFVPPPPSPITNKKKRLYTRRNPESAVCKACLRGTSPASNMIVFCDGCNAPYHRWCHKPPIDQTVVEELDKEWFCKQCESERVMPVPESEVANFVSAEGASAEQRQKYFSSLPPGVLVTLLTKATSLHADLPLFDPEFRPKQQAAFVETSQESSAPTNGQYNPPSVPTASLPATKSQPAAPARWRRSENEIRAAHVDPDEKYTEDVHPSNYPRPGKGLMSTLPPDQEDLQYLVDDEDKFEVFTHVYQKDFAAANAQAKDKDHQVKG